MNYGEDRVITKDRLLAQVKKQVKEVDIHQVQDELGARRPMTLIDIREQDEVALLINSAACWQQFGPPRVSVDQMIERVAAHLKAGGRTMGKPTHFEVRDGKF